MGQIMTKKRGIILCGVLLLLAGMFDLARREPSPWQLLSVSGRDRRMQSWVFSGLDILDGDVVVKVERYKPVEGEPSDKQLNTWVREHGEVYNGKDVPHKYIQKSNLRLISGFKLFLWGKGYKDLATRYAYTTTGFSLEMPHMLDLAAAVVGFVLLVSALLSLFVSQRQRH